MTAKKGDWVRIHKTIMPAGERAPQVPEDTAKVPFEMWDKGFLMEEKGDIGNIVTVQTAINRIVSGTLIEIEPFFQHSFGNCIPEILWIDRQLRTLMREIENEQ